MKLKLTPKKKPTLTLKKKTRSAPKRLKTRPGFRGRYA